MRHVIGYLVCLTFLTLVLTLFGFFPNLIRNNDANVGATLTLLQDDPNVGPAVRYTVSVFGTSFSPVLVLGHFLAIVISPIGLFALLFYFVLAWMLPAR